MLRKKLKMLFFLHGLEKTDLNLNLSLNKTFFSEVDENPPMDPYLLVQAGVHCILLPSK